ncbi:kinase domain protein [Xylona heveae TC161]|uniref:non-specific serine/threonine protein kinase n=1 Tax=Xylona heveae (strain CBS 132557 / TC161) TaxID=1328760 RepID=A0A165GP53_XYLHT|nr:kinase domain protein [Xylona heveae TC161]KZF22425.1 kinase domain protein [Xylona heveae TC161]
MRVNTSHPSAFITLITSCQPRVFSSSGFTNIDLSKPIEEETLPDYLAERYYPVHIGEIYNSRYQVVTKLGFGSSSTVWLCRDLYHKCYITLKVHVRSRRPIPEVEISNYLRTIQDVHGGEKCVRLVHDSFQVQGPHGVHQCLLYQPAGVDISDFMHYLPEGALPEYLLRPAMRIVLVALDYLHQAKVVHTDIQPNNILLGVDDVSILAEMEEDEIPNPVPRKQLQDRIIYTSCSMPLTNGEPVLSDLGEARFSKEKQCGLIMPSVYRAPEVMLGMSWDYKVDIWAAWTLFEQGHLFKNKSLESTSDHAHRFAEMVSLLGPPPLENLVPIPDQSLEGRESQLEGGEKGIFLQFIRKVLRWLPEERPTALELLSDEWLRGSEY